MIRTKKDAQVIIENLGECMLKLHPNNNLQVCITKYGCREFYNGDEGVVGQDDLSVIVDMLYRYRKTYNAQELAPICY